MFEIFSTVLLHVDSIVFMNMAEYNVSEGDGVVHVCVEIGNVPAEGLQWDIVVTLTLADGFKGGNF